MRTDPARLREVERLLAAIDVAARNLTITVRNASAREIAAMRHGATGRIEIGNRAAVELPDHGAPRGDLRADDGNVSYRARAHENAGHQTRAQTLLVQDGQRAYVRIGQSIPHVQKILTLSGRPVVLRQEVVFEEATTGFDVLPRLRGETVHSISPRA